jgi:hypothetical protein
VLVFDRSERRNRIDQKQRGMLGAVDGAANLGNAAGDPRRGFVVNDHHRLDAMLTIVGEAHADLFRLRAAAPIAGQELDVELEFLGEAFPQRGEMPGLHHQHFIAGRERIHDRRLPRARS